MKYIVQNRTYDLSNEDEYLFNLGVKWFNTHNTSSQERTRNGIDCPCPGGDTWADALQNMGWSWAKEQRQSEVLPGATK